MRSTLNVEKTSNRMLYLVIITAPELKVSKQEKPFVIQYQKHDFFQNSSVPFHQVTFDHSILYVLLTDKPNKSCKNSKTFERTTLSTKKAFKKERK